MLVSAYMEGINLHRMNGSEDDVLMSSQGANGFELLRQLTHEYSLRSRAEALSLRASLATKSFVLSGSETTTMTVVSDIIRRVDLEAAKYAKLVATLPVGIDNTGLAIPEADLLLILLRSLPESVRNYCLHHSVGDSYMAFRETARRWETQQRLFHETYGSQAHGKKQVHQLTEEAKGSAEWYSLEDSSFDQDLNAISGDKCGKCGSKKHSTSACTVDLAKIKCFSCGGSGHIGANCPNKRKGGSVNQGDKWSKGKGDAKGQGGKSNNKGKSKDSNKGKGKGKGKAKGFGKKGKLNETIETDPVDLWYEEGDWWFDADWNTWVTSSMYETWDENAGETTAQADGSGEQTNSLIISMMHVDVDEIGETGLFLEDSGLDEGLPSVSALGHGSMHVVPQPFVQGSGSCSGRGSRKGCKSVLCGCFSCVESDRKFSKAWSTHRMKLHEKRSKGLVSGERLVSGDGIGDVGMSSSSKVPTCWSGFCGLKGPEGFCEGSGDLVSQFRGRLTVFKAKFGTFLNDCDTCSKFSQFVRYSSVVMPLLSQMSMDDSSWWLLDSGASATVLAERFATSYGVPRNSGGHQGDQFKAANGTAVKMSGKAEVGVRVVMVDEWGTKRSHRNAQLKAMVGDIQHNIISTTSLCKAGWEFWQGDSWFELRNKATGEVASEVGYFAGCPWIRLQSCGPEGAKGHKVVSFVGGESEGSQSLAPLTKAAESSLQQHRLHGPLAPLTRAAEAALRQHRLQGHVPYDPRCLECSRGRTTFQHRRRKENLLESELQADFAFISSRGELTDDEVDHCYKVLVLSELSSNCVGYLLVTSDLVAVRSNLVKWLDHMGLSSERASIVLHTDSERAVSELVTKASDRFVFIVRRAAPQQHRSVGHAERAVRRLKESLAVVRSDLNRAAVDIAFSNESLGEVLTYLGLSHNHYGKAPGCDLSPLEFVAGRNLTKPVTAMYGMNVLAEIPQSLRQGSPNEARNVEAMFLHHGLGTGPVVQAMIRHDGEMKLRKFVARNLKPIFPFSWNVAKSGGLLVHVVGVVGDVPALPDAQMVPDEVSGREMVSGEGEAPGVGSGQGSPDQGFVEYPDGAPAGVVRDMKGPETHEFEFKRGSMKRNQTDVPTVSNRPMTMRRQGPISAPTPVGSPGNVSEEFGKTEGCPACQSGMNAPGIRHSSKCRRRWIEFQSRSLVGSRTALDAAVSDEERLERERSGAAVEVEASDTLPERAASPGVVVPPVEDMEVEEGGASATDMIPESQVAYERRFKRPPDVSTEQLEREMNEDVEGRMDSLETGLYWSDSGQPVLSSIVWSLDGPVVGIPATSPDMFDGSITSIQFNGQTGHQSEAMQLGGSTIRLWRPDEVIDDSTLASLDAQLGYEGMMEEIRNLNDCGTGETMSESQVANLKQKYPSLRLITCRWVSAYKSEERVRCRIVAKDIKRGTSARSLGFSSPTPSIEGLHATLTLAANRSYLFRSLDVAHAFMHSPMPKDEHVVLRLPLSVSFESGDPVFMYLFRSLNGLRNASMHWLSLLARTIEKLGLWSDETEPCIYGGYVKGLGHALLVAYVDDVLLASENEKVQKAVEEAIGKVVPVKVTGSIQTADKGGGSLTFIGRTISRAPGHSQVTLSVKDDYLKTAFDAYDITSGSKHVPDVAAHLEKTMNGKLGSQPLSPEAYARFRRTLGKLLWLAQSCHDLKVWLSLIGTQQASPKHGTEMALRSVLRFLYSDKNVHLMLPSPEYDALSFPERSRMNQFLHAFADASFAPYRFNARRGMSGGVVFCEGGLVRSFARQQQALSLSSCEAELYALQMTTQESVAFTKFCHRVLFSLGEVSEPEVVEVMLESDSSSALQLIQALDLPKRSRHVEIRLLWIRGQVESGKVKIRHRPGLDNVADLFTKCLPSKDFLRHRATLGFVTMDSPLHDLMALSVVPDRKLAMIELCCRDGSMIQKACETSEMKYCGVTKDVQMKGVVLQVKRFIAEQRKAGFWVHMHVSTPCTSGSPLRNLSGSASQDDPEWKLIMDSIPQYLEGDSLADSVSFELPRSNSIWERPETKLVLQKGKFDHAQDVHLCQAGYVGKDGLPIGKVMKFMSSHKEFCFSLRGRFGRCVCDHRSPLDQVSWTDTGFYNKRLARAILNGAKACWKKK